MKMEVYIDWRQDKMLNDSNCGVLEVSKEICKISGSNETSL